MKSLERPTPSPAVQQTHKVAKFRNLFFIRSALRLSSSETSDVPACMTLPVHHSAARMTLPPSPVSQALPLSVVIALMQMICEGIPKNLERKFHEISSVLYS